MLYMTAGPWDPGLGTVGVVTVSWPKDRFRASAGFTAPTTLQKLAGPQVTALCVSQPVEGRGECTCCFYSRTVLKTEPGGTSRTIRVDSLC